MTDRTLEGKVAIITGAARGLGKATVRLFTAQGALVVAADMERDALAELDGQAEVAIVVADVRKQGDVDLIVDTAMKRYGKLDILVNNAAIVDHCAAVDETTDENWQEVLATNLTGPFLTSRRAIPIMLASDGGVIVNISSVSGLAGGRAGAAYSASKHGLIGLTKNIAATHGDRGIRCVAICPGRMHTRLGDLEYLAPTELGMSVMKRTFHSSFRGADPEEVARVVLFAASEAASYVNGAAIVADGGMLAH